MRAGGGLGAAKARGEAVEEGRPTRDQAIQAQQGRPNGVGPGLQLVPPLGRPSLRCGLPGLGALCGCHRFFAATTFAPARKGLLRRSSHLAALREPLDCVGSLLCVPIRSSRAMGSSTIAESTTIVDAERTIGPAVPDSPLPD